MNRRSLLRFLGLGGAAAVGEAVPGIGKVWIYGGLPIGNVAPMADSFTGNARYRATERMAYGFTDRRLIDPATLRLHDALDGPDDYALAMTDWGGAL